MQYERSEVKNRVRDAIETLPARERRVIALYYYDEVTMKEIGAELGVNESRVSQLHARALRRLREALGAEVTPVAASAALRAAILGVRSQAEDGQGWRRRPSPESDTRVPQAGAEARRPGAGRPAIRTARRARRAASRPA